MNLQKIPTSILANTGPTRSTKMPSKRTHTSKRFRGTRKARPGRKTGKTSMATLRKRHERMTRGTGVSEYRRIKKGGDITGFARKTKSGWTRYAERGSHGDRLRRKKGKWLGKSQEPWEKRYRSMKSKK